MLASPALIQESFPLACRSGLEPLLVQLAALTRSAAILHRQLESIHTAVSELFHARGMLMIVKKNKWGFNKEEAKKLFYSYRSKNEPGVGDPGPDFKSALEPETTEKKIAMIMDYMKETSAKLDRIEDDIAELKEKVNDILKKM